MATKTKPVVWKEAYNSLLRVAESIQKENTALHKQLEGKDELIELLYRYIRRFVPKEKTDKERTQEHIIQSIFFILAIFGGIWILGTILELGLI